MKVSNWTNKIKKPLPSWINIRTIATQTRMTMQRSQSGGRAIPKRREPWPQGSALPKRPAWTCWGGGIHEPRQENQLQTNMKYMKIKMLIYKKTWIQEIVKHAITWIQEQTRTHGTPPRFPPPPPPFPLWGGSGGSKPSKFKHSNIPLGRLPGDFLSNIRSGILTQCYRFVGCRHSSHESRSQGNGLNFLFPQNLRANYKHAIWFSCIFLSR